MKIKMMGTVSLALMFGVAAFNGGAAFAQQKEPSRQDRIREHQDRIQKIIEESRKRREDQQKAQATQAGQTAPAVPGTAPGAGNAAGNPQANAAGNVGVQPGQPLPTGPVQNARMQPPIQKGQAAPPPAAPQAPRSESRTIMMFHPIDSIVAVGDRFRTDIVAETKEGEIDEISYLLKYPRHILNPLGLIHSQLDPLVQDKIDYEFNPDEGTIYIHAKLKKPTRFGQQAISSIIWEALEPTDGSVISYEFGENKTTGLYLKGQNLLGTLPGAEDGVIRTTVQVTSPKTKPAVTKLAGKGLMIGEVSSAGRDDRPEEKMEFVLKSKASSVRAGDEFDVDVVLNNPGEKLIDRLRLYLQFDPAELSVVDSDIGNVVKKGVNIQDAPYRAQFPFDYYRFNRVDNTKGVIEYEVSASNSKVRGTGKVATIRMKALTDSPRADLILVRNAEGVSPTTDVSYLSESKLGGQPAEVAEAMSGVGVRISGHVENVQTASGKSEVFNPFGSDLARRMQGKAD